MIPHPPGPTQAGTTAPEPVPHPSPAPDTRQTAVPGKTPGPRGPGREQLPLFSRAAEAKRSLQEELGHVHAAYGELQDRYYALVREHRALRQDLAMAQATIAQHEARIETLSMVVRGLEHQRDTAHLLAQLARSARVPPTPDSLFKRLLAICHPDKWAQAPGASALAHELTVAINHLREQEGGRP